MKNFIYGWVFPFIPAALSWTIWQLGLHVHDVTFFLGAIMGIVAVKTAPYRLAIIEKSIERESEKASDSRET